MMTPRGVSTRVRQSLNLFSVYARIKVKTGYRCCYRFARCRHRFVDDGIFRDSWTGQAKIAGRVMSLLPSL